MANTNNPTQANVVQNPKPVDTFAEVKELAKTLKQQIESTTEKSPEEAERLKLLYVLSSAILEMSDRLDSEIYAIASAVNDTKGLRR
jgi:ElaB/YqjD/DUF883 family membrane-anchored ribosome-binding protein